jgi:hypothetical protein
LGEQPSLQYARRPIVQTRRLRDRFLFALLAETGMRHDRDVLTLDAGLGRPASRYRAVRLHDRADD